MLRALDNRLNNITMYKLVLWALRILTGTGLTLSFFGILELPFIGLALSLFILSAVSYGTNVLFSRIWRVPTNTESYAITLLILFLIMPPVTTVLDALELIIVGVLAITSKFVLTHNNKHIFNPAAFAAASLGLFGLMHASWWVGNSLMWPLVLILGLLIVRKIRRFSLFAAFILTGLAVTILSSVSNGEDTSEVLRFLVTSSPLIFLGTVMLTEPGTMPARRKEQIIFGAVVGFLATMPWNIGPLTVYPETALVLGNIYAFAVNPQYRLRLKLKSVQKISDRVYNYSFEPDRRAVFLPGQYMEWTFGFKNHDSRGNRRTFSIASSPTENDVMLGVKFYDKSSRFKDALRSLTPGATVYAGQFAGDFTLPEDKNEKLLFIAGGIGITPYRSMLKYLLDTQDKRDIVLIYAVSDLQEIAYTDVLDAAERQGVRIIKTTGRVDAALLKEKVPQLTDRKVYISGPDAMVHAVREALQSTGITRIKTDYFSGY